MLPKICQKLVAVRWLRAPRRPPRPLGRVGLSHGKHLLEEQLLRRSRSLGSFFPPPRARYRRTCRVVTSFWQNVGKMLLVFGCIGTDFCKKIRVLQHFSKSTRLSSWNFWNLTKFCKFCDICKILLNFHDNCWFLKPIFCENFEIAAVQKCANLVELEKCCQTHIFLQNLVLIQPRTSPPKFCKFCKICQFCN